MSDDEKLQYEKAENSERKREKKDRKKLKKLISNNKDPKSRVKMEFRKRECFSKYIKGVDIQDYHDDEEK